jgi:hypothetical protein
MSPIRAGTGVRRSAEVTDLRHHRTQLCSQSSGQSVGVAVGVIAHLIEERDPGARAFERAAIAGARTCAVRGTPAADRVLGFAA